MNNYNFISQESGIKSGTNNLNNLTTNPNFSQEIV